MIRMKLVTPALCLSVLWATGSDALAQRQISPRTRAVQNSGASELKQEAESAYQSGRYSRVVDLTTQILQGNPQDHVAYYLRGSARVELGLAQRNTELIRTGISDSREAVKLGGKAHIVYYLPYLYGMTNLAKIENRPVHAETAVTIATQVLTAKGLQPNDRANLYYQRAIAQIAHQKYDLGVADFQEAIRINPNHMGAVLGIAEAWVAAGNKEKALTAYGAAIDAFPNDPLVYNNRGMFLQQQGKNTLAITDFSKALEMNNQYYVSHTNRGFALMELGDFAAAENDFSQSLQIKANQSMVHTLRGTARLSQGKKAEAHQDYERVIQLDPRNPVAHSDLAFTKFFSGDYRGALTSFTQAQKLNPQMNFLNPWRNLSLERMGQGEVGKREFAAVLQKPVEQRDWVDRVLIYQLGGMTGEQLLASITGTDESLKDAQSCEAHFFIGEKSRTAGDLSAAGQHFQSALNTSSRHLSAYRGSQYAMQKFDVAKTPASPVSNTTTKN